MADAGAESSRGTRDAPWARMKPHHYAFLAAAILAGEATFAIIHRAVGAEYAGYNHVHNVTIDFGLAILWLGAALAALVHRALPAFLAVFAGAMLSIVHGEMYSVSSGHMYGLPFILAAGLIAFALKRSAPEWPTHLRHARA